MKVMRRLLFSMIWCVFFATLFAALAGVAGAEETVQTSEKTSSFLADVARAREILLGNAGDNPFGRGFMVALFQPVFLASMFCLGLWAGQMSERIRFVWVLPVFAFVATVAGAFITTYHADWKPVFDPDSQAFLHKLSSTDAVAVIVGLMAGAAVAMGFVIAPFFAIVAAIVAGLALGFSQTAEFAAQKNALMPFWAGFGLTGLMVNIFGIGFETFLQSISLAMVTRWIGFATLALSFMFGTKIF
jgi:hypothetical protein